MEQSVPKRRHIKFRRRGITPREEYKEMLDITIFIFGVLLNILRNPIISLIICPSLRTE